MRFSLLPRNDRFFDLFSQSASNINTAALACLEMVENFSEIEGKAKHLKELESKGDSITHEIIDYLNESFITPFDRDDILHLAGNLDDVLDEIEGFANRLLLFNIDHPTPQCAEIMRIVVRAAGLIEKAIAHLRHFAGLQEFLIEVNSLENQVDEITRKMTAKLFHDGSISVLDLIKWKEIYARLEHTADRMEDVANIIEDIVVKNS
jgi:predicted phosphate transport protein (TIGR00153 family)